MPDETINIMSTNEIIYLVDQKLETKAGLNRFHWNLRHPGPWSKDVRRRYQNGPMVAPGTYTTRLTIGEQVFEQTLEIKLDPRVAATNVSENDIKEQIKTQLEVRDLLSTARKLQDALESELKKLKGKKAKSKKERFEVINKALKQLKNDEGAYPQQMLVSQISYLLNMISGADQIPGKEADNRLDELKSQLSLIQKETMK